MKVSTEQRARFVRIAEFASIELLVQSGMRWLYKHRLLFYHLAWLVLLLWLVYQLVRWTITGIAWLTNVAWRGMQKLAEKTRNRRAEDVYY